LDFFNKMNKGNKMNKKKLKTGDLVHIPSEVYRFKKAEMQLDFFSAIKKTSEPMLGLFKKHLDNGQCLITFNDGEWVLPTRFVYEIKGERLCLS
jgi:hypothetical protein